MSKLSIFQSKRFWIALAIFTGLFFLKHNPLLIGTLLATFAVIYNPATIRPLKNYKFWIVIALLIFAVPLFTGTADKSIIGISYSSVQLQKTLLMTLRGISIFLLFQVLTTNLSIEKIKPIFNRFGSKNFETLYNLSNEIFPKIKSILLARYTLFNTQWKTSKTINSIINYIVDIFTDFFDLIDQLGSNINSQSITPIEILSNTSDNGNLILITGDAGAGKTAWIEEFVQHSGEMGVAVDGLYSKKVIESDGRWYHNLIRVSSHKNKRLNSMEPIETTIKVGKFYFFEDSINWGNSQLSSIDKNVDWVILDEIGLLEFDKGGLLIGLQNIACLKNLNFLITIRSSLLKYFDEFLENNVPKLLVFHRQIVNI